MRTTFSRLPLLLWAAALMLALAGCDSAGDGSGSGTPFVPDTGNGLGPPTGGTGGGAGGTGGALDPDTGPACDCGDKQCGVDNCGNACGQCAPGQACNDQGMCELDPCDCGTRECGEVCGNLCGACGAGEVCNGDGQCVGDGCGCGIQECGQDACGNPCGTCPAGLMCSESGLCVQDPNCGCGLKECGEDACGVSCGTCPESFACSTDGLCVPEAQCTCAGKECGQDACGNSCGSCAAGQTCNASGQCEAECGCAGKECGDDGCGNSCGGCPAGWSCSAAGMCEEGCSCGGKTCGDDGCGNSCGTCPGGQECTPAGQCQVVCDCSGKACGDDGCGNSCGSCAAGEVCTAANQCAPSGPVNGAYCGYSESCPALTIDPVSGEQVPNPNVNACLNAQCNSGQCIQAAGELGVFATHPVCTIPCTPVADSYDNATGLFGADGIEDPDAPGSDCAGFAAGPAGSQYRCAQHVGTDWFCTPGSFFATCASDGDCPAGEGCFVTTVGGFLNERCMPKILPGPWGDTAQVGDSCNEADDFAQGLNFCESGLCYGFGCASLCETDADCNTTAGDPNDGCDLASGTCKLNPDKGCSSDLDCSALFCDAPATLFSNIPEYTIKRCFPKPCEVDADCGVGTYCRFYWNGLPEPDDDWDNLCLNQNGAGAGLGDACDDEAGLVCANEDLCVGGFCSALCQSDADCATDKDQLCTAAEFEGDADDDGEDDFALGLSWCTTFPGHDGTECYSDQDCGAGTSCWFYSLEVSGNSDMPFTTRGVCVAHEAGKGDFGDVCTSSADCNSGVCLGATADTAGYCTAMCESHAQCPAANLDGTDYTSRCSALLLSWGGQYDNDSVNTYVSLCQLNPAGSAGTTCSSNAECSDANDVCFPYGIDFGPDYVGTSEGACVDVSDDVVPPTQALGVVCNETLACADGFCVDDGTGTGNGLCSQLCATDADCTPFGMTCQLWEFTTKQGAYAGNGATTTFCQP